MRKIGILSLLVAIITCSSCEFNQSVNTDLTTGAYSRGDGLGCENVAIEINGTRENRNEFISGESVNLIFNNISGLTKSDGKTYPSISMHIVQDEKDTVVSHLNLIEDLEDGTDLSPLQLQANFTAALPYENNEQYKVCILISDNKGDGTFTYELPFTIIENDLLEVENKGMEYVDIYLWNESLKQPVFNKNVSEDDIFILILEGIEGLTVIEEKVFPIFSIDLIDNKGTTILSNANMLSLYEDEGIDPKALKSQLTAKITFDKDGNVNNPCKVIIKLKDKNSAKELTVSTELNVN